MSGSFEQFGVSSDGELFPMPHCDQNTEILFWSSVSYWLIAAANEQQIRPGQAT